MGRMVIARRLGRWVGAAALAWPGAGSAGERPSYLTGEPVVTRYLDRGGSDLLTGGLGAAGLARAADAAYPPLGSPPTTEQLRTAAIYFNYRALVDTSPGGGYGTLYGPNLGKPAEAGPDGQVYGTEYLAHAREPGGRDGDDGVANVALMVQIPEFFGRDGRPPCIVTGPSSGSRGVYGAIGTSGEWGLKKGCAVAYTDKGTGIGAHDLAADAVNLIRGERVPADAAGERSNFTADLSDAERAAFLAAYPNRWAFKHAQSRRNPEARWDEDVTLSLRFALWALNRERAGQGPELTWANTLVIASGVSNGGAASLRAAEEAPRGMIDAVVVSEPNVNPEYDPRFVIADSEGTLRRHSRPLFDYLTLVGVYQGCANLAPENATAPLNAPLEAYADRCAALARAGLLPQGTVADQAARAQAIVNGYGLLKAQNDVAPAYWAFYVVQAVDVTYANAYARASVTDRLCGYSFAATGADEAPAALAPALAERLFATGNGIPPTGGVNVVNDRSPGGPRRDQVSVSPSTGLADQNLDGARCLRSLWTGSRDPRDGLWDERLRVRLSVHQIKADGRLRGVPTIVLHGRDDALVAPNHTSRAYYALSRLRDGERSRIRYYEVTSAQHLDALNPLPGFGARFVPLHRYFVEALDLMWAHLTAGAPLPASKVVRTVPRGGGTSPPAITETNVPRIDDAANGAPITFDGRVLRVPG